MDDFADHPAHEALWSAVRRGASSKEIAALRDPDFTTPDDSLLALEQGNERFYRGESRSPTLGTNDRRAQIMAQTPFAVVLGCSDSRVPTEMVFDQGFGDLFIVRVAGNVASAATLASIEFAILHLKCRLLVVMGHEGCGAVQAAMLPEEEQAREPEALRALLAQIRPAVEGLPTIRDPKARMREAVINNIRYQAMLLQKNAVVADALAAAQIRLIGAFYEIGSGAVDFIIDEHDLAFEG